MGQMGFASWHGYAVALGVALLLGLISATGLRGQEPWPQGGARVRVAYPCDVESAGATGRSGSTCRVVGEFLEGEAEGLTLITDGASRTFDLDAIRRLEVSRGLRSHRVLGAAAGLALGSGATYLVLNRGGSTSKCDQSANQDAMSSGECLGLAVLGGVVGGVLGGVVGGFIKSERWEEIGVDRFRVSVVPGKSVGVRISLTR